MAMTTYTIKSGDTLTAIARKYGTTVSALVAANGIADPNKIYAGSSLKIPTSGQEAQQPAQGSSSGGKTIDRAATNAAREAAAASGKNPSGIYVYTDGSSTGTSQVKTTTIQTGASSVPEVQIPADLADDPDFQSLDDDNKALASYIINASTSSNKADAEALKESLTLATEQADVYWGEKISIIKDELTRALGDVEADLVATERDLMLRKDRIEQDLKTKKSDLTIDQQTDLAAAAKNLDIQLYDTREAMAAKGLSSSTYRNRAEQRLKEASSDIVESTTRAYARAERDIETEASRNVVDIMNQISDAARTAESSKKTKVSAAEQYLGSAALSGLSGASPYLQGSMTGSMLEEKTSDILARQKSLLAAEGLTT